MSLTSCIKNKLDAGSLKRMHYLMGTLLSIEVFHPQEVQGKEIIEEAFAEVKRIEEVLSRFRQESRVYQINHSAHTQPQGIGEELFFLAEKCSEFSHSSGGAFDISVAPLMDLWSKAEKDDLLPKDIEISSLLSEIGYQNIVLDRQAKTVFFKTPSLAIDFGAVGKGYSLDRAAALLKDRGIKKARFDFGGHLHYFNESESEPDYIGLRNPLCPDEILLTLPFENKSVSTSANYERNFKIQNRIYGHLVNPLSGYPVQGNMLSVSVFSSSALEADILSTAGFSLGLEEGMRLVKNTPSAEAIFITDSYGKAKIQASFELNEVMRNKH